MYAYSAKLIDVYCEIGGVKFYVLIMEVHVYSAGFGCACLQF